MVPRATSLRAGLVRAGLLVVFGSPILATPTPWPLGPDPVGAKNIANGQAVQFIDGQCLGNAACASTCCATLGSLGTCSGLGAST